EHPVGAPEPLLDLVGLARAHRVIPALHDPLAVVGMNDLQPPAPEADLRLLAEVPAGVAVEVIVAAVGGHGPDELRQRLGQELISLLARLGGTLSCILALRAAAPRVVQAKNSTFGCHTRRVSPLRASCQKAHGK